MKSDIYTDCVNTSLRYVLELAVELWALSTPIDEQNERMFVNDVVSDLELEACLVKK